MIDVVLEIAMMTKWTIQVRRTGHSKRSSYLYDIIEQPYTKCRSLKKLVFPVRKCELMTSTKKPVIKERKRTLHVRAINQLTFQAFH